MKIFKALVAFLLFVSIFGSSFGQQVYSFRYDDNGNRTSRIIDLPGLKSTALEDSLIRNEYKETIDNLEIIIYPNPTYGELTIQLVNYDGAQDASISIFDFGGHLIYSLNNITNFNKINLSENPYGTYLLRIRIGNSQSEWKVVKK